MKPFDYEAFKRLVDDKFALKRIGVDSRALTGSCDMSRSDIAKVKKLMKVYNYVLFLKTRHLCHARIEQERADRTREEFGAFSVEQVKYMLCRLKIILLVCKYGSLHADGVTGEYIDYVCRMHTDLFDGYDFYMYTYMLKALRYEHLGMLSGNIKVIKSGDFINYMRSIECEGGYSYVV